MASRKFLIEGIMSLAQKLGANPSKYMGTKQNINFLGTGNYRGPDGKGTTFSGLINEDIIGSANLYKQDDIVKVIEQDMGFVTANKLNDIQLNTMYRNLKTIDEAFNPPPGPANVIDLETGTGGLNKEGLESLRETDKIKRFTQGLRTSKTAMTDKIKQGIESLKTKIGKGEKEVIADLQKFVDDIPTRTERTSSAEKDFVRMGAANFGDSVQAEGARRAVVRQLMRDDPDYFLLPPETADSISRSLDLGRSGANYPDPLVVFRNIGNFTRKELEQIDDVINESPFDDITVISERVKKFIKKIRPDGFRPGFSRGGIGRLMSKGIKTALKRTREGYDTPGADFQVLTQSDSYLMSPPNMQMLEKLKILRRQLVRDIKRKEGGGKYTFGPDPKATKKDLDALDEYIADLMKKISVEGYYGEGRAAEKALLESDPSLPFSKLVKDRYRSADGGRIGFRSGKFVKDGIAALLRLGNKKFGKDTIKIADEIDRPEAAKLRDEFRAFNERTRKLTDEEYAELQEIYGEGLPLNLETVGDAEKFIAGQKAYEAAMFADYKAGRLDPKPGEPGRKKFLEKKAQEAEMSGDSKLFTRDEAEELGSMKEYGGPKTDDYYKKSLGEVVPDDYNQLVNVPLERITPGILRVKYPGIPDELAELIGTDTNLQRKAEAIAAIEQALALKGAGKSADEVIAILKGEPKTKMSKGGLARILEM